MLFKREKSVFLPVALVLFCFIPCKFRAMGVSDDIFYDGLLKPMLKKTLCHVKMNNNKHGFFNQHDFSTFSFSVPLIYRQVSVDNVMSFFQGLAHWRKHEENLKFFFCGFKDEEYGSIFEDETKYKFLERYKNLTYSSGNSTCTTVLYSWYMQIKKSNFFFSYGLLYEYSKHVYSFDYYIFKYDKEMFKKMYDAYNFILPVPAFLDIVDEIIRKKYPRIEEDPNIQTGEIKPNLDSRYDNIVEKYAKEYIKDEKCRQGIKTLRDIYWKLNEYDQKRFEKDLKSKYIDYNVRNNWEGANKFVSFCVNDFGVHVGVSYLQNKIDPFYGFYCSMSLAAGIQYITCVSGIKINDAGGAIEFDNNCFAFLRNQCFYKNLFSFFIKIRLEAGYGLLRFFISFKSLDLKGLLDVLEPEMKFQLGEKSSAVRLEEYNEACYETSENLVAKFNIKNEEGFRRFLPKIIQFGFTLNL